MFLVYMDLLIDSSQLSVCLAGFQNLVQQGFTHAVPKFMLRVTPSCEKHERGWSPALVDVQGQWSGKANRVCACCLQHNASLPGFTPLSIYNSQVKVSSKGGSTGQQASRCATVCSTSSQYIKTYRPELPPHLACTRAATNGPDTLGRDTGKFVQEAESPFLREGLPECCGREQREALWGQEHAACSPQGKKGV